uniref:Uncharacterized protein n=1 Tax=viral metagenome TaxID=1070528 RepID=A0A6C0H5A6_9ZZZZ
MEELAKNLCDMKTHLFPNANTYVKKNNYVWINEHKKKKNPNPNTNQDSNEQVTK